MTLFLNYCQVFGESVVVDYNEFIRIPYRITLEIIKQRSKLNKLKEEQLKEQLNSNKPNKTRRSPNKPK